MESIKTTPLHQWHQQNGGKMVEFAGWEMPIQYQGIIAEHEQTRRAVSLFDVSHMGLFMLDGKDSENELQKILTNDVTKLVAGQAQYTLMLHQNGTVVDDLTVYRIDKSRFMLCVNAANIDKDYDWICSQMDGKCTLQNWSEAFGQIAVQGKYAEFVVQQLCKDSLTQLKYYNFIETVVGESDVVLARMGYTGEDGFEIFCKQDETQALWDQLLEKGKTSNIGPAGLGARDLLRLEMGFPLYGNDLDDQHVVAEANLKPFVRMDKIGFIGKSALKEFNPEEHQKLIHFVLEDKGVPRANCKIFAGDSDKEIGEVTSGNHSPVLGQGIGMGYVDYAYADDSKTIRIEVRNKKIPAKKIKGSFIKVDK